MPSVIFNTLKSKLTPTRKTAFFAAFLFGIAAHFYRMTNWLPNWDSLVFRDDPQHMEALGRWFLPVASKLSTDFELPWLNGLLTLVFVSAAAVIVCEIFDVKSRLSAALIGAVIVTFPTVTSTFTYCYVSDAYAMSFLLTCVAVYLLTRKGKLAAIPAVLLLVLSVGIYQAYITTAVALITCTLVIGLVTGTDSAAASLRKAAKYLLCGVIACACYYAVQTAVMTLGNIEALDYQEFAQTLSFEEISIVPALEASLYSFYKFFIDFSTGFNLYSTVNIAVSVSLAVGYVWAAVKKVRGAAIPLLVLYILIIPFGCSALYFINSNLDFHTLMKMGFVVAYLYLILLYEKVDLGSVKSETVKAWIVTVLCGVITFSGICTANVAYHKLQMSYEKSYGILMRISDRIESLENIDKIKRILVVGQLENSEAYSVTFPPEITGTTDGLIIRHDDETVKQSVLTSALNDYTNLTLDFLAGDEARALKSTDTVKNMPCFPAAGSVACIDDIVVVKLSEEPLEGE